MENAPQDNKNPFEWLKRDKTAEGQKPGHIGHVLVSVESGIKMPVADGNRFETLNRNQLLKLSQNIVIEGSSLRQIYETHLIGERGLRRLMAENERGNDLGKALRQEIIEREIDFERDPQLRDSAHHAKQDAVSAGSTASVTGSKVIKKLLKDAHIEDEDTRAKEEMAFFRARADYEENQLIRHKKQRQILDVGMIGIILILLVLVISLYLTRG